MLHPVPFFETLTYGVSVSSRPILTSRVSGLCGAGIAGPGVVLDLIVRAVAWSDDGKSGLEELAAEPVGLEYPIVAVTCSLLVASARPSDSDLVLVRESAEDLFPADPVIGEVDWLQRPGVNLSRRELAEGTVRPGCVVMQQVLGPAPIADGAH